jgi:hypothetical protein
VSELGTPLGTELGQTGEEGELGLQATLGRARQRRGGCTRRHSVRAGFGTERHLGSVLGEALGVELGHRRELGAKLEEGAGGTALGTAR